MTTIKSYTDVAQSKTLSNILPFESADGTWVERTNLEVKYSHSEIPFWLYGGLGIPSWSLATLLEAIPYPSLHKTYLGWRCDSYNKEGTTCKLGEDKNNPIDACYEMILKLHELNLL